jgi:hypothetical protein
VRTLLLMGAAVLIKGRCAAHLGREQCDITVERLAGARNRAIAACASGTSLDAMEPAAK